MHVRVEEPVADRMFEEGADDVQAKSLAVKRCCIDSREVA